MSRRLASIVLALAFTVVAAHSQSSNAALSAAADKDSTLEENLRRLTDEVGGRRTGSPEMRRAVDWGINAFRKAGVDSVKAEPFAMPSSWSEGATRIDVLAPASFRL